MYFLKCDNCGHFNEVKTEYLTFCKGCNKVLKNNYSNWFKANRDKSFDDFKLIVCTTELTETSKKVPKSNRSKGTKFWIGFAITFAIFFAIGQFGGEQIYGLFKKPAFDKVMMEAASEINKTCPVMVDNVTRLDNSIALPNNVFQYNYTLVSVIKDSCRY